MSVISYFYKNEDLNIIIIVFYLIDSFENHIKIMDAYLLSLSIASNGIRQYCNM